MEVQSIPMDIYSNTFANDYQVLPKNLKSIITHLQVPIFHSHAPFYSSSRQMTTQPQIKNSKPFSNPYDRPKTLEIAT